MTPDDALDELYGIANRAYPQDDDLAARATNTLSDWMNTVEAELDRLRAIELRVRNTPADVIDPEFVHYLLTGDSLGAALTVADVRAAVEG